MISLNELCIANFVKCIISNDTGIYKILSIPAWQVDSNVVANQPMIEIDGCQKQTVYLNQLRPIIITEQILVDCCKFTKTPESDRYGGWLSPPMSEHFKQKMRLYFDKKGDCYFAMDMYGSVKIKGLHHLQNLMQTLYGFNLEVDFSV